jgi:hypothetical protein
VSEDKTEILQERQALRRQLRRAGWTVGTQRVKFPLWPAPHTGPAEGVEPRWVEGKDMTEALRTAVRELCGPPPPEEPERPETVSE